MIPVKDTLLVPYSTNFDTRINANPALYFLTVAQATTYNLLHKSYLAAYEAISEARSHGARSKSLTLARDTAKAQLLKNARELYAFVQANTSISDAHKADLGVHVRKTEPSPHPIPTARPGVAVASVVGNTVGVRISNPATPSRRARPANVTAAWVYSYVGPTYPSDPSLWNFEGSTSTWKYAVNFPSNLPAGTQVWIAAAWINARQESGPVCTPVTTYLQFHGTGESEQMKIAA